MEKKKSVWWLNFLYSFMGFEIILRGWSNIGTLVTIITGSFQEIVAGVFSLSNVIAFIVVLVKLAELVIKLIACIKYTTYDGFVWIKRAMIAGGVSGAFYMVIDRGFAEGAPLAVLFVIFYGLNFLYVRSRESIYKKGGE